MAKVKLELEPYDAITILSFLREFINEDNADVYQFKAIHEAVESFQDELASKLTAAQREEINAVNQVNQLIGKSPKAKRNR